MKQGCSTKFVRILTSAMLLVATVGSVISSSPDLKADCTPPAAGLVGWWQGEGNATDSAGTNNGILASSGVTFASGKVGQGFRFDGTNGYVQIPDSAALKPTNVTVEAWVWLDPNVTAGPTSEAIIFKRNSWTFLFEGYSLLKIAIDNGNGTYTDRFQFVVTRNGDQVIINSTTAVQRGVWYHVAGTYDGNQEKLYVNGVAEASAVAGFALDYGTLPVYIGTTGEPAPYNAKLKGIIDEPSIYNRALTVNEIAAIYAAGSAGKCAPGPVVIAGPITNSANGHSYYLLGGSTWTEAEAKAVTLGGHLVTINDDAENAWVLSTFGGGGTRALWIGLNDAALEGSFVWVSGDSSTFRKWSSGEPNNYGGNENYAYMGYPTFADGTWNDQPDSGYNPVSGADNRPYMFGVVETDPMSSSNCTPPPAGLAAWWPGEANANDIVSGNNGTWAGFGGINTYSSGTVGQAFVFDGTHRDRVDVGNPASLQLQNLTIEAWIKRSSAMIASLDDNFADGSIAGPGAYIFGYGAGGYGLFLLDAGEMGLTKNSYGDIHVAPVITDTNWHHVAVTKSGSNVTFYVDGAMLPAPGPYSDTFQFTTSAAIGSRGDGGGNTFYGKVDELSIYNRALSSNEIKSIYNTSNIGKCIPPNPPSIALQPVSKTVLANSSASFNVVANGTQPLAYQWRFNNTNIIGATNSTFALFSAQLANSGNYSVVITNLYGSATSSSALLTVTVPDCTPPPSGLVGWWPAEGNVTNLASMRIDGTAANGVTFTNGEVGSAFKFSGTGGITISNSSALNPTNAMTVEFWMKRQSIVGSFDPLVKKSNLNGTGGYSVEFDGSSLLFYVYNGAWRSAGGTSINIGQWYHIAGVFDLAHSSLTLYVNGVKSGTVTTVATPIIVSTNSLGIGKDPSSPTSRFYNGLIDEVSIYNRALTTNEIATIYAAGNAGKCMPQPAAPIIVQQPANQTVIVGDTASFNVVATGTQPLTYQWFFKGNNIAGETNSSLMLTNTQLTQAGNYSVMVVNVTGPVVSSNAILTVTTPVCTTAPSGLVGWWSGNDTSADSISTNHGILGNGVTFGSAKVGNGFSFTTNSAGIRIPANPALNVGAGSGLTIECWIKPLDLISRPLVEWNDGAGSMGIHFWEGDFAGPGTVYANLVDMNGIYHVIQSAGGVLQSNVWQHLAMSYDHNTGIARLYCNGVMVKQQSMGIFTPRTGYDLYLGNRPVPTIDARSNVGGLDEVSIYNRALSTNEIAAIYAARGAGKCPLQPTVLNVTPSSWYVNEGATIACTVTAVGSPVLTYQWQYGGLDIVGATNATLTLNNVTYAQAGNYAVVVSNPAGLTTSSNILLRVNRAPIADASATDTLAISPNGTNAVVVLDGSHSSDPDGDALTYAWFNFGDTNVLATSVVAITPLPVGTNQITLTVNDGAALNSQTIAIEVITTSQAVDRLIALVKSGSGNTQPLIASLRAALAAIDRSQPAVAINQLEAFINKVQVQLAPSDSVLAAQLIADAQAIIDALNGGTSVALASVEINSLTPDHHGKAHLKIKGINGRVHVVETSTNMVDWVPVGVANQSADGSYEFDASDAQDAGARFYRVVSPK